MSLMKGIYEIQKHHTVHMMQSTFYFSQCLTGFHIEIVRQLDAIIIRLLVNGLQVQNGLPWYSSLFPPGLLAVDF
jgi:hypothetical protein